MKNKNTRQRILLYLLLLGISCRIAGKDYQADRSIRPYQLKGLRTVIFFADVDTRIPNNIDIEKKIEKVGAKLILEAGVAISSKADSVLSISVSSYPIEVEALSGYVLFELSIELIENVCLLRKTSLKESVAGITWSKRFIDVIPCLDIENIIMRVTESLMDDLISNLKTANLK